MTARDDYPTIARFSEQPSGYSGEMRLALDEIDVLRERCRAAEEDADRLAAALDVFIGHEEDTDCTGFACAALAAHVEAVEARP